MDGNPPRASEKGVLPIISSTLGTSPQVLLEMASALVSLDQDPSLLQAWEGRVTTPESAQGRLHLYR